MTVSADVRAFRAMIFDQLNQRWRGVYESNHGAFIIPGMGNTVCMVDVAATDATRVFVDIHAPLVVDIPPSQELFEMVALSPNAWDFGSLNVFTDGVQVLEFKYVLVGESVTSALLNYLVERVATIASDAAPDYKQAFGGRLVHE